MSENATTAAQRKRWIKALSDVANEMQAADDRAYEAVCTALGQIYIIEGTVQS